MMHPPLIKPRLEPNCDNGVLGDAALVSIAVSLKRIADLLDGTTLGLNVNGTIFNPNTAQSREVRNHY